MKEGDWQGTEMMSEEPGDGRSQLCKDSKVFVQSHPAEEFAMDAV